jgi:hypothetical protein
MGADQVTNFISGVQLATPEQSLLLGDADFPPLDDDTAQAAVVDSNLVTFPQGTPLAVKNAVGAWLLLAQRAASAKVPDKDDTRGWVAAYHDVLEQTGWVRRGDAEAWVEEEVMGFKVHEKILAVVSVVLGPAPAALAIVTAALTSLQQMNSDSPWITLFDRRGRSASSVGFQVANCVASSDRGASLHSIDFQVHAHQVLTQVLFFKFTSREAKIFRRGVVLELTPAALATYGPVVEQRVHEATLDSIAALELAEPV